MRAEVHDPDHRAVRKGVRAAVALTVAFLIGIDVVADAQFAVFAAFTTVALLGIADYQGDLRARLAANAATLAAGAALVAIGTAVSTDTAAATVTMFVVALVVAFTSVFSGYFAAGANAVIVFLVVATGIEAPAATIGMREAGLALGGAIALVAAAWVLPSRSTGVIRSHLADVYDHLAAMASSPSPAADGSRSIDKELLAAEQAIAASAWRPGGLSRPHKARMYLLHGAQRTEQLLGRLAVSQDALPPVLRDEAATVSGLVAGEFRAVANALRNGGRTLPDPGRLDEARRRFAAVAARALAEAGPVPGEAGGATRVAEAVFSLRELSVAAVVAAVHCCLIFRAPPTLSAGTNRAALAAALNLGTPGPAKWIRRARRNLTWRSVHLHNSLRIAAALALARLLVGVLDLSHGFWVAFATLVVVKTSASATRVTATQAAVGTALGFALSVGAIAAFGIQPLAYSVLVPVIVFLALFLPGAVSFTLGQACFTILVVVLFNLVQPQGWTVALARFEDVLVGAGVGVLVGFAAWPKGAARELARAVAALVERGDVYATTSVRGRVATVSEDELGSARDAAFGAAADAEDVFSQWLAEPHADDAPALDWSSVVATAHRIWFGAGVAALVPVPEGCASREPVLAGALEDAMAAAHADHERLCAALTAGIPLAPVGPTALRAELGGAGLRDRLALLELRAWACELAADVSAVAPAVARVAGRPAQPGLLRAAEPAGADPGLAG